MAISKLPACLMVLLLSLFLHACGGAGLTVADGGISGTGITMGRITKFGSIYVNGIKFNVDQASFIRDGNPASDQSEFSVGEYVVIKGFVDRTGLTGIASEVVFEDIVEGAVTHATSDNLSIEVLGQTILTDASTQFHGFAQLSDLVAGNIVEVSGLKNAEGLITATSIKLKQSDFVPSVSQNELKGTVTELDTVNQTFLIKNIVIDYSQAEFQGFAGTQLKDGQFIEAKSNTMVIGNTLQADQIKLEKEYQEVIQNTKLKVEGIVTRFNSIKDFDVNGIPVTTNQNTQYKKGTIADVVLNAEVDVKGKVGKTGVLLAAEIELEKPDTVQDDNSDESSDDGKQEESDAASGDNSKEGDVTEGASEEEGNENTSKVANEDNDKTEKVLGEADSEDAESSDNKKQDESNEDENDPK